MPNAWSCFLLEHLERFEIAVQQLMCVMKTQPAIDHGRVDPAEVGGVEEIAAGVQFSEAGNTAELSALHLLAGDEHEVGCTVIGAEIDVFRNPASEFREDHDDYVVRATDPF